MRFTLLVHLWIDSHRQDALLIQCDLEGVGTLLVCISKIYTPLHLRISAWAKVAG